VRVTQREGAKGAVRPSKTTKDENTGQRKTVERAVDGKDSALDDGFNEGAVYAAGVQQGRA